MTTGRYTQKIRAKRIELDYFKRPHPLRRWKTLLSIALPLVAGLWLVAHAVRGDQRIYTSGPVSTAHTMFGARCSECHVPAASTTGTGASERRSGPSAVATAHAAAPETSTASGPTRGGYFIRVSDQACSACHAGPVHHDNQVVAPTCASCHLEHKGRVDLAALADQYCTQCHADLSTRDGKPLAFAKTVSTFSGGHPEFAVAVKDKDQVRRVRLDQKDALRDTAQIKLNHQKHLKVGLKGVEDVKKLTGMRGLVQAKDDLALGCSYCHTTDDPDRSNGRSRSQMAPVSFAKHCVACHPLDFDGRFPDAAAPHDTPTLVHAYLRTLFTETFEQCQALPKGAAAKAPERRSEAPELEPVRKRCEELELVKAEAAERPRGPRGRSSERSERSSEKEPAAEPKGEPATDAPRGSRLRGGGGGGDDVPIDSVLRRLARRGPAPARSSERPEARGEESDAPRGSRLGRSPSGPADAPAAKADEPASDRPRGRRGRSEEAEAEPAAKGSGSTGVLEWVASQLPGVEKLVFKQKCEFCHVMTFSPDKPPVVAPTAIPVRWMPHGVFDHGAHRSVGCLECHKAATSTETTDVLLPSASTCRECHRPAGGARAGCVECHLYHDKSKDRDLNGPFTIPHLVTGKRR